MTAATTGFLNGSHEESLLQDTAPLSRSSVSPTSRGAVPTSMLTVSVQETTSPTFGEGAEYSAGRTL